MAESALDTHDLTGPLADILPLSGSEKDFGIKILAKSVHFDKVLVKFMRGLMWIVDPYKYEDGFKTMLDLVIAREKLGALGEDVLVDIVDYIGTYKYVVTTPRMCGLMVDCLRKVLAEIPAEVKAQKVGELIEKGKYGAMVNVAYSLDNKLDAAKLVENLGPRNYPCIQALVQLFKRKTFADLEADDKDVIENAVSEYFGNVLNGFERTTLFETKLLAANLHFKVGANDPTSFMPMKRLLELLIGSSPEVKLAIAKLFAQVPAEADFASELSKMRDILVTMCRFVQDDDDHRYTKEVVKFAKDRMNLPQFYDVMEFIFTEEKSYAGAIVVCEAIKYFDARPEMTASAFPRAGIKQSRVLHTMKVVKSLRRKRQLSKPLLESVLRHLSIIYASEDILKKQAVKTEAIASVDDLVNSSLECLDALGNIMIGEFTHITDADVLTAFGASLAKIEIANPPMPLEEMFCNMFCHVFPVVKCCSVVQHIVRLFVKPTSEEEATTMVDLIDRCVPKEFVRKLFSTAEVGLKASAYRGVICVSTPDHSGKKLAEIAEIVLNLVDTFTYDAGVQFFTNLSVLYFPSFLVLLETHKLGEKITRSIIVPRKKRILAIESVKAVFASLPTILKGRELTHEQQESLWRGICYLMPEVKYEDVQKEACNLHEVFPYIKDVMPSPPQYSKFLKTEFARDLPVFLAKVDPSDSLAVTCVDLWFEVAKSSKEMALHTKAVAELVFRLSQKPRALFEAVFKINKGSLPVSEVAIPYAIYICAMAEAAHKQGVRVDESMYVKFFFRFSRLNLCQIGELRTASVAGIAAVFRLGDAPTEAGNGMSPEEVNSAVRDLYCELAKHTSDRFITDLLKRLVHKRITQQYGYLIYAIFAFRENLITEENRPLIMRIFERYQRLQLYVKHQVENGAVALAERSMKSFIPILVKSDTALKKKVMDFVLRSADIRPIFVNEFHLYLNSIAHKEESFRAFLLLRRIISTEPSNELSDEDFGAVVSGILMHLGLLYSLVPVMNLLEIDDEEVMIARTLRLACSKTARPQRRNVRINVDDAHKLTNAAGSISKAVCGLSISKIAAVVSAIEVMFESRNDMFVVIAGVFCIHLAAKLVESDSAAATDLVARLAENIIVALEKGSVESKLYIVAIAFNGLPNAIMSAYSNEQLARLYKCTVDGLRSGHGRWRQQRSMLMLSRIIRTVSAVSIVPDELLTAMTVAYDHVRFKVDFLSPLEVYLTHLCNIHQFKNQKSRLSLYGLADLLSIAESRILSIISTISGSEEIVPGVQAVFTPDELALWGLKILDGAAKPYSPAVVALLCRLVVAVENEDTQTTNRFKQTALRPLLAIGENKEHVMRETVASTVVSIVK